ncbi:MAG TPA: DUF3185 family protein [Candidatus Paceibacterota bacterium]|nr:DUF3185 family protein [Candidatus Paceibacterota bacterium]
MKKIIGIALLAGGVVLLVNGFKAKDSVESQLHQAFRGSMSKNAIWLLAGGAACSIAGTALILMPGKTK